MYQLLLSGSIASPSKSRSVCTRSPLKFSRYLLTMFCNIGERYLSSHTSSRLRDLPQRIIAFLVWSTLSLFLCSPKALIISEASIKKKLSPGFTSFSNPSWRSIHILFAIIDITSASHLSSHLTWCAVRQKSLHAAPDWLHILEKLEVLYVSSVKLCAPQDLFSVHCGCSRKGQKYDYLAVVVILLLHSTNQQTDLNPSILWV